MEEIFLCDFMRVINWNTYVFVLNYLGCFEIMVFIFQGRLLIFTLRWLWHWKKKCFMYIDASRKFVRNPSFWLQITCVVALLTQDFIDTYCYLRFRNVAFSWLLLSKPSFSRHIIFYYQYSFNKYYLRHTWYLDLPNSYQEFGLCYYLEELFEGPQDLILRWPFYLFCNRTTRETC